MAFLRDSIRRERTALALLAAFVLFMTADGLHATAGYNDFEVYVYAGTAAFRKAPDLYTTESPVKQRKYVYPPSAAVLLMPLGWVPYQVAAAAFNLFKAGCLVLLLWGVVAKSGLAPPERERRLLLMLGVAIAMLRPIDNDAGHGQINLPVAAMALAGVWLMMESRRWWWAGSLLLALGVAIKTTPLLLLAVPFLHRRWKPFVATLAFVAVLGVALPMAWFGRELTKTYSGQFGYYSTMMAEEGARRPRQVSLFEMLLFSASQWAADDSLVWNAKKERVERVLADGTREKFSIQPPWERRTGQAIWFVLGAGIGAAYLIGRWRLARGHAGGLPWQWDLAMMCVLSLLVAPLVRQAHLVMLVAPAGWIACRVEELARAAGGWRSLARTHRTGIAMSAAAVALVWIGEDLGVPVPGFVMNLNACLFVALLAFVGALAWLARSPFPAGERESS